MSRPALAVDFKNVMYVDSSGADSLRELLRISRLNRVRPVFCGLNHQPLDIARRTGLLQSLPEEDLWPDLASGLLAVVDDGGAR